MHVGLWRPAAGGKRTIPSRAQADTDRAVAARRLRRISRGRHSPRAGCDEDQFPSDLTVRRVENVLEDVAMGKQRRHDLVALTEAQRRVRRQHGSIASEHPRLAESDQRPVDVDEIGPALQRADSRDLNAAMGRRARPSFPRPTRWITSLKDQMPTRSECAVHATQGAIPIRGIDDRLRDVRRHRREIGLHRRQRCRVAMDPAHPIRTGLRLRYAKRAGSRIDSDYLDASLGKQQRQRARTASEVQHATCAELLSHGDVRIEVAAVGVERVVEGHQPRVLEVRIGHAADDTQAFMRDLQRQERLGWA